GLLLALLRIMVIRFVVIIVEQLRRIVFDDKHIAPVELLPANEVIAARLELELQEIGLRHKARFRNLSHKGGLAWIRGRLISSRRIGICISSLCRFLLCPFLLVLDPFVFVFFSLALADGHAVFPNRATDMNSVTDVPHVLLFSAEQRVLARANSVEL